MAFGDSITEGKQSVCNTPLTVSLRGSRAYMQADFKAIREAVNNPTSYPSVLNTLLLSRYGNQSPVVFNEGLAGEEVLDLSGGTNDATLSRLSSRLQADVPEALLLQEGVNDLDVNPLHPDVQGPRVVKALHDMIVLALNRGVKRVFLGTLLPQQPGACRGYAPDSIAPTNTLIRAQASADGAVLVDLYQAFGGVASPYIGPDGLHPNDDGYRKIAETFRDSIKATLETPR
jgi:lysophospholipase L1-like esterase